MPRYHFHVRDGVKRRDRTGMELPDLRAARHEAVRLTAELLLQHTDEVWFDEGWWIEVADDRGMILCVLNITALETPLAAEAGKPGSARET